MPTKLVDGVRMQTTPEEDAQKAADEAAWLAEQDLPRTYVLPREDFLDLLYDGTREAELQTHIQGLNPPRLRRRRRAFFDGAQRFRWGHQAIVDFRQDLSEGVASFSAAWVAKGKGLD